MPRSSGKAREYLEQRFGVSIVSLEGLEVESRSGDFWLVPAELPEGLELETAGIRAVRDLEPGLKPTTYLLQLLGERIERCRFSVGEEELRLLLEREEMVEASPGFGEGYVALEFDGKVFGCGFYADGKVSSRIPKSRSGELLRALD